MLKVAHSTKGVFMRKKLIAGNWKMNGLKADAKALAEAIFFKSNTQYAF